MTNEATATASPNETIELAKAGQVLKFDLAQLDRKSVV